MNTLTEHDNKSLENKTTTKHRQCVLLIYSDQLDIEDLYDNGTRTVYVCSAISCQIRLNVSNVAPTQLFCTKSTTVMNHLDWPDLNFDQVLASSIAIFDP